MGLATEGGKERIRRREGRKKRGSWREGERGRVTEIDTNEDRADRSTASHSLLLPFLAAPCKIQFISESEF